MDKGFNVLHKIVQAADARQKVLASNIANADTPGYKSRDVKFSGFVDREIKLLTTDPKHIGGNNGGAADADYVVERNPSWGDGNNVEISVELAKMTENALTHDAAVTILSKKIKMYRSAITGR